MPNRYCTATNTGKGFITHQDRNDFYLSGNGAVWIIGPNANGTDNLKASAWLSRVSATIKTKAEAQAIVDAAIATGQARWDALSDDNALKLEPRPEEIILPQELIMATYTATKGVKVQSLASDPSNLVEGTVWYNTTSGALKFYDGSSTKTVTVS